MDLPSGEHPRRPLSESRSEVADGTPKGDEELPRRGLIYSLSFAGAVLGAVVVSLTPASVTLAMRIGELDPANKNTPYAWAIGLGSLMQLLISPLAGQLSDASSSRFGMRKPWIVVGALGTWLGAFLLSGATSSGGVIVAWAFSAFFIGLTIAPLMAVISDQFRPSQHGFISGLAGSTPLLGILIGSWIVQACPQTAFYKFVAPATLGSTLILQYVFVLKDKERSNAGPPFSLTFFARSFLFNVGSNRSFAWLLLVFVLTFIGAAALQNYMVYLLEDSLKIPVTEIARATFLSFLAANAAGCAFSLLGGTLSDWLGRRKPVYALGAALMSIGLIAQVISKDLSWFLFGSFLAGVGFGLFNGLLWALAVESGTEGDNAARDLGLVNVAFMLPGLIVPLIAGFVTTSNTYSELYLICATASALAIPALLGVRKAL
jgi:MFS family permease